ncbi:MAG: alpha/beta fold hydrolase, partial [Planctomycetaceae bacterium]
MTSVRPALFIVAGILSLALPGRAASPQLHLDQWKFGEEFQHREFPIAEGNIACAHRPGIGPTLVLIPGTLSDSRAFAAVVGHLDKSLNLVLIENRGLGRSWPPPERGSIEQCARDAITILDAMQIEQFFVGGHSLGGMISLELGWKYPDRVLGIVSIEGWTNSAARDAFDGDTASTLSPEQVQFLADYRQDTTARWTPAQIADFTRVWRRWDGTCFLDATDLRVLEMYGDRAKPRPDRRQLGIPDRKNIELVWLEGASHSLLLERPMLIAKAINEFVLVDTAAARQNAEAPPDNDFDVVVVGGTPGGIAAAVSAARLGRSVALVEYHRHLGGMTSGGLSSSDIRKLPVIQGFFREFVDRVLTEYTNAYGAESPQVQACMNGYRYEPSVAERVFNAFVQAQPTLTVLKDHQLEAAETHENRITAVTARNRTDNSRRTLNGKVIIDATYEGDVYAAAGADFRVGRESRDEYGEPHAGHIYCDVPTQKVLGGTGAGDDRLTAYTYRPCVTTDPANQVRLTAPPAGYDRTRYLGYLDDAKSGRFDDKPYLALITFTFRPLPNDKFDLNMKAHPLGYVFAEENRGYATADWHERERIADRIRDLTLGLLWFLQHDDAVPPESREHALRYHLCRDEFTDNGHFPFQLYVREARRLVGEYVLTERNTTEQPGLTSERRHEDAIAVGEHPIDCMPAQKRQPGDTVVL